MAGASEKIQLGAFLAAFQVHGRKARNTILSGSGEYNCLREFSSTWYFQVTREMIKAEAAAQ